MTSPKGPSAGTEPSEERIDAVFCQVLEYPREQWHQRLVDLCAGDLLLLREVEGLLKGADRTDTLLRPGGAVNPGMLESLQPQAPISPGTELGRYRILREIGRGGMGIVYLAERSDGQFDQRVALKVTRSTGDPSVLDRFTRERQILADLKHPNIAHLIDGGLTPDGFPFLVMDYVDGTPADQYCRDQGLDLRQRIRLLMEVCAAVQAAHRQLVVHRDLKPSNILVTREGQVKLLDFGIAKLLDEESQGSSLTVARLLTPQYASPEQLRGERITVASDVYQLGLIAYELITERRPYDLSRVSAAEAERKICHDAPTLPSSAATVTQKSSEDWKSPKPREIKGDLDTIILKALHKDPDRRYGSVGELEEDLGRFLNGLPVLAQPDAWAYRLEKFVGRNKGAVAAGAAAFLTVLGLVAAFTWGLARERDQTRQAARLADQQRLQAEQQREETEEVLQFLMGLFEASDPRAREIPQSDLTARELLDRGAARLEDSFADRPAILARLLQTTGGIYGRMELFEKGEPLLRQALALREADATGDHRQEIAESLKELGTLLIDTSKLEEAEALLRRSLDLYSEALGPSHPTVAASAANLAEVLHRRGFYEEREVLLRKALAIYDAQEIPQAEWHARVLHNLGRSHTERGDLEEAERLLRRSLEINRDSFGPDSVQVAASSKFLALNYWEKKDLDSAMPLFQDSLRIYELRAGPESLQASNLRQNLAVCYYDLGDWDRSEALMRQALSTVEGRLGKKSPDALSLRNNLAALRLDRGDAAGAESDLRRLRSVQREALPPTHKLLAFTEVALAKSLLAQDKHQEAISLLEASLSFLETSFGPQGQLVQQCLVILARSYRALGEEDEAERHYRWALRVLLSRAGPENSEAQELSNELAELLSQVGREDEAAALRAEMGP